MLRSYRVFLRDAKNRTRVLEVKSDTVEKACVYVSSLSARQEIENSIGLKIKPKTPILIEVIGGLK